MKTKTNNSFFKKNQDKLVVILIIIICSVLAFIGFLEKIEYKLYDGLLGLHKNPETRSELLIVEIDNESTTVIGAWPWNRDVYADQLIRMKELGADTAVFDIEYLSPSNMIVTDDDKKNMADTFENFAYAMQENPENASVENLYFSLENSLFHNSDDYFSSAIQFFGNTWLTINIGDIQTYIEDEFTPEEVKEQHRREMQFVYDYCLYKNITDNENFTANDNTFNHKEADEEKGFSPAMHKFITRAKGAGFTNVILDRDGVRRHCQLLEEEGDKGYVGQLVVAPILKKYDVQHITRKKNSIELQGVKDSDSDKRFNIKIPLDNHGRFFINWKHEKFLNSFRHTKIAKLNELDWRESDIANALWNLAFYYQFAEGATYDMAYTQNAMALFQEYEEVVAFKKFLLDKCKGFNSDGTAIEGGISDYEYESYFAAHREFFEHVGDYVKSSCFSELYEYLATIFEDEDIYDAITAELKGQVDDLAAFLNSYNANFEELNKTYKNSFCIIGQTTSSSTDLGTIPFEKRYPNIGTHANVYNTILTQEFITPLPWFVGIIIASVLALILAFFAGEKKVGPINIAGTIILIITIAIPICSMMFAGYYIQMLWPTILVFVSFITIDILHFFRSEKDKSFLKHAFATYLNPKSVNEIIEHPEKLSLGGEQKHLTALFSDIQKFSSFSESVTPEKLVAVLKTYLGNMSDCILDEGGTIDKYEGDAIIAFFGAPAELENAAYSACASAIRMKQAEKLYNDEHTKTGFLDRELNTRIGINTGEMVVGNMGTDKKFNYTIMGNDVNLASRLEGVNKAYKSWILTSEATWNEANSGKYAGKIVARRFDRVRVVNIDKPVQLYNILGFRDEMTDVQLKAADIFEEAMKLYLSRQFNEAAAMFTQANQLVPEDESPLVFAERCKEYAVNGVPEKWTGVTTLTSK